MPFVVHCIALIIVGDVFNRVLILDYCSHVEYYIGIEIVEVANESHFFYECHFF